jgi:hypothetical protein
MELLIMQFSPTSYDFISLQSKYSLQYPVLKKQCMFSLNVRDQVSHPYRTTSNITLLYILIFKFLDSRQEGKRFWAECYKAIPELSLPLISS